MCLPVFLQLTKRPLLSKEMEKKLEITNKHSRRSRYMRARKGLVVLTGGLPLAKEESTIEAPVAATQSVATQSECCITTAMKNLDINTTSTASQTVVGYNVNEMFDIRQECLELLETRRLLKVDIEWLKQERSRLQKEVLNLKKETLEPYTDLGWKLHRPTQAEKSEKLSMVLQIQSMDTIMFSGMRSVLSNFYMTWIGRLPRLTLLFRGTWYHSAEQAYQHHVCLGLIKSQEGHVVRRSTHPKACKERGRVEECERVANLIMSATNAPEVKAISRQLYHTQDGGTGREQWKKDSHRWFPMWQRVALLEEVVQAKWEQCQVFRDTLAAHPNHLLLEWTGDQFWGIGVPRSVKVNKPLRKLKGANTTGWLLMKVRDKNLGKFLQWIEDWDKKLGGKYDLFRGLSWLYDNT